MPVLLSRMRVTSFTPGNRLTTGRSHRAHTIPVQDGAATAQSHVLRIAHIVGDASCL